MQRHILCAKCGAKLKPLCKEDAANGFVERVIRVVSKRPEGHGISMFDSTGQSTHQELPLMCDLCAEPIPDGEVVYAETTWNTNREGTPGNWEKDFGTVIADDVAKVVETLSKPLE